MKFAIVDLTGNKTATELAAYAAAQQRQLREHYAACYDGDGDNDVVRVAGTAHDLPSALALLAADESPIIWWASVPPGGPDGAIGVHDRLPDGRPICNAYDSIARQAGVSMSSVSSHEVLETRADPRLHACVELDDGTIWDREICDRVEADVYQIDGVELSNFNTPACFEPTPAAANAAMVRLAQIGKPKPPHVTPHPHSPPVTAPHERYDWMDLSLRPNEVRHGGYAQEYVPGRGWTQHGAMRTYRAELAKLGLSRNSRRARRTKQP